MANDEIGRTEEQVRQHVGNLKQALYVLARQKQARANATMVLPDQIRGRAAAGAVLLFAAELEEATRNYEGSGVWSAKDFEPAARVPKRSAAPAGGGTATPAPPVAAAGCPGNEGKRHRYVQIEGKGRICQHCNAPDARAATTRQAALPGAAP